MILRWAAGPHVSEVFSRSHRVANWKFKEAAGWAPSVTNAREGWQALSALVPELPASRPAG